MRNLYDGVPLDEVYKASILAARTLIEKDPDYTFATARLLLHTIFKEVIGREVMPEDRATAYADYFPQFIKKGVQNDLLDEKLLQYDLPRLGAALKAERDNQFDYLGLQTLYDRYFLHVRKPASSCRRLSSCAWPWACRSTRSTAKRAPSSSMKCCRRSTSCRARPPCSTPARCARSCPAAT
jgi:hypothetical protein